MSDVEPGGFGFTKALRKDTETEVINDIRKRQELGLRKYGVSVAMNGLTDRQWLQHLYEELLDAAIYAKRRMQEMDNA